MIPPRQLSMLLAFKNHSLVASSAGDTNAKGDVFSRRTCADWRVFECSGRWLPRSERSIAYNWSGVYFGSSVGYGWGDADIREDLSISVPPGGPLLSAKDSHSVDGWLAGVHLGAMKQFGWLVGGTEFSLSGANVEGSTGDCAGLTTASGGLVGVNCNSKVNWLATAVGRTGVAWDRFLVYGSLGYALRAWITR
jgi:hypothetical protein